MLVQLRVGIGKGEQFVILSADLDLRNSTVRAKLNAALAQHCLQTFDRHDRVAAIGLRSDFTFGSSFFDGRISVCGIGIGAADDSLRIIACASPGLSCVGFRFASRGLDVGFSRILRTVRSVTRILRNQRQRIREHARLLRKRLRRGRKHLKRHGRGYANGDYAICLSHTDDTSFYPTLLRSEKLILSFSLLPLCHP